MFDKNLLELPGMRAAFGAMALFSLFLAACALAQAISLSVALTNIWAGKAVFGQTGPLACFLLCLVLRRILVFAREETLEHFSQRIGGALETQLLAGAFSKSASLAKRIGTAATAQTATEGIDEVQRYIRVIPPKMCDMAIVSLALVIALFAIDWVSAIIVLVALPITVMFMVVLGRQARARVERQYETSTRLANHFIDTLRGVEELDALGAADRASRGVFEASEKLRVATVRTLSVAPLSSAILDLVNVFAVAACAMMLAFRLMDGSIELAYALCALILAPDALAPLRAFASEFHASLEGKTALASVLSLLEDGYNDKPLGISTAKQQENPLTADGLSATSSCETDDERLADWDESSSLTIEHASYRYEGSNERALDDITLTLCGHERVALVGSSGSGKTTLADIVAGFRSPESGLVSINGYGVSNLDLASWKRQIAYIPQNPYLFRTTLRENIAFYAPDAADDAIVRAVEAAGLEDLVHELPLGLDTVLGDGGRGLSGGQAQRIALARALLANRPILVFDEPTAHLDIETERELKQQMLLAMRGKLVVFATHRLHWLDNMDRVIVLEKGRIADVGTFEQLKGSSQALERFMRTESPGDVL